MTVTWRGVFPAVTTQFHNDQSLHLDGTAAHLEKLLQKLQSPRWPDALRTRSTTGSSDSS